MPVKLYRKSFSVIVGFIVAFVLVGCDQPKTNDTVGTQPVAAPEDAAGEVAREVAEEAAVVEITELQIIDVVEGDGANAQAGQEVVVHYTGWLYEPAEADNKGTQFDSSVDRGDPFVFSLGAGRVIKGWDAGVAGMKVGGKRTLIIPASMAYGERGAGADILPGATLMFDVELLDIR
jgi:FKBP-type peptidyl-prolyl cis-trans isomerase FkpA